MKLDREDLFILLLVAGVGIPLVGRFTGTVFNKFLEEDIKSEQEEDEEVLHVSTEQMEIEYNQQKEILFFTLRKMAFFLLIIIVLLYLID